MKHKLFTFDRQYYLVISQNEINTYYRVCEMGYSNFRDKIMSHSTKAIEEDCDTKMFQNEFTENEALAFIRSMK